MTLMKKIVERDAKQGKSVRELTKEELLLVAGGSNTIVVTGRRDSGDYWDYNDYYDDDRNYEDDYSGGGGGGGDDGPAPEPETMDEATKTALEGFIAVLEEDLQKMIAEVGDFEIEVGDFKIMASDLLESLGKLSIVLDLYEAHQLTNDLISGDATLGDAVAFVATFAITVGMTTAGFGPIAIFAATAAAGYLIPSAFDGIVNQLRIAYDADLAKAVDYIGYEPSNPNFGPTMQQYDFLVQLFGGTPIYDGFADDPYYDPYYGGSGYTNPHYNIP